MDVLYKFQEVGAEWLSKRKVALLADEMGLGKSVQAIVAAKTIQAKSVLVVCPAVARENWEREFQKWKFEAQRKIVSFEFTVNRPSQFESRYDVLVIDEVHFLKSIEAKRSKAVFGKSGVVRRAERIWTLSGTPAPNHAGELWILLYTFGAVKLDYWSFVKFFCDTIESGYGIQVVGTKRDKIPKLQALLSKVMLRRMANEVMELPPISFSTYVVEAGKAELDPDEIEHLASQLGSEEEILKNYLKSPEEMLHLELIAQSISTLRRYTGLQKVEPVSKLILEELENGLYDKIVIFAIHKRVIEQLEVKFKKMNPVVLYGSTQNKQLEVDKFQTDKTCRVFLGNILSAGVAITLTAANQVVFVEQDFVPGNNAQAARRCRRIGQTKPVSVRFISLANPLDERLTQILRRKTKELSEIFD